MGWVDRPHQTGIECRNSLHQIFKSKPRIVPAFTYQSLQKNVKVQPPPKINVYMKRIPDNTLFSTFFNRGDIPACTGKMYDIKPPYKNLPIQWFCDPKELDYCYYLPIFVDGIADKNDSIRILAKAGAIDLIIKSPTKVLPALPKLILPLKRAFWTNDKDRIMSGLKILEVLVMVGPCVGQAIVPYYRQLLPICNMYKNINVNLGHEIDPDRSRRIGDVIDDTLKALERCGGPNAFINIKYMIPTYETAVYPSL